VPHRAEPVTAGREDAEQHDVARLRVSEHAAVGDVRESIEKAAGPAMARSAARLIVPPVVRECRPPSAVRGGALLVAGGKLLDSPAIAIGVTEEHEPPRQGKLDVSDVDAGVA